MLEKFDAFLVLEIAQCHPELTIVTWKAFLTALACAIERVAPRLT